MLLALSLLIASANAVCKVHITGSIFGPVGKALDVCVATKTTAGVLAIMTKCSDAAPFTASVNTYTTEDCSGTPASEGTATPCNGADDNCYCNGDAVCKTANTKLYTTCAKEGYVETKEVRNECAPYDGKFYSFGCCDAVFPSEYTDATCETKVTQPPVPTPAPAPFVTLAPVPTPAPVPTIQVCSEKTGQCPDGFAGCSGSAASLYTTVSFVIAAVFFLYQ